MPHKKEYRKNAGIIVFNEKGEVLAGDRIQYPGMFQFPQGGIDDDENPLSAAYRELYEETGLRLNDQPVAEYPDWLYYDFPPDIPKHLKKFKGQMQKWYLFFWNGQISQLNLNIHEREFNTLRWQSFRKLCDEIVAFKRPVYEELHKFFSGEIERYLGLPEK